MYTHKSVVFSDDNANTEPEETQHEPNKIFQYFDPNVARWRFADGHHSRRFDSLGWYLNMTIVVNKRMNNRK